MTVSLSFRRNYETRDGLHSHTYPIAFEFTATCSLCIAFTILTLITYSLRDRQEIFRVRDKLYIFKPRVHQGGVDTGIVWSALSRFIWRVIGFRFSFPKVRAKNERVNKSVFVALRPYEFCKSTPYFRIEFKRIYLIGASWLSISLWSPLFGLPFKTELFSSKLNDVDFIKYLGRISLKSGRAWGGRLGSYRLGWNSLCQGGHLFKIYFDQM
jgi:hypothetical protein